MRAMRSLLCLTAVSIAALQLAQAQPAEVNELAKLLASDGMPGDTFGMYVAIEGDTAVIGAPADLPGYVSPGWAYVFEREGGCWTQRAKLWASDGAPHDQFGENVAISGDTIMVGAHLDDENGVDAGAVYVFEKPTEGWHDMTETCKLLADDGQPGDIFGYVALSGDTAVIGAPYDDDYAPEAGCAYVFEKGTGWVDGSENQVAKLWASDAEQFAAFGFGIAIRDQTIVIGAPTGRMDSLHPGSAYVFEKPPGGWMDTNEETAMLTPSDGQPCDSFGNGVALSADASVILIGAHGDDDDQYGVNTGSAYVFEQPPQDWVDMTETHKITNGPDSQAGELFGGPSLNLNADGDIAVIGTYDRDGCGSDSGAAHVFRFDGSTWNKEAMLTASDCAQGDRFGYATALSSDTVLIGAFMDDETAVDAGAVYAFRGLSDCNFNSELDICEIADDPSLDADSNGVLDECENEPPVAEAGPDQTVNEGELVTLSGSASVDPDDDPLTFQWTQSAGPAVTLDITDPVHPTFYAPLVPDGGATLTFQLVVNDGQVDSDPAIVNITVKNVNRAPVADAGEDQTVAETSPVTLDGSASFDPDGETITFAWVQTAGPAVSLTGADTTTATFDAPLVGFGGETLTFELTVSDGIDVSSDAVTVLVENVNHDPVAHAGPDQTRDEGTQVSLDGTASIDPDGDLLTYEWVQLSGPAVTLSDSASRTPTFTAPPVVGSASVALTLELTVDDGLAGLRAGAAEYRHVVAAEPQDALDRHPRCDRPGRW